MKRRPLASFILSAVLLCLLSPSGVLSAAQTPDLKQLRKAAERGDASAANKLGVYYEKGKYGLTPDTAKAVEWYRKAAKAGNILAMHNLGDCYQNGVGVPRNPAEAYAWYKKTAEAGGAIGYEDIGRFFETTGFGKPDREKARIWYTAAAKQGRTKAQERLLALGGKEQTAGKPFSPCPRRETGKNLVAGTLRGIHEYGPAGAGSSMLTLDVNGTPMDIFVDDTSMKTELRSLFSTGKTAGIHLSLGTVSMQGLEDFTARCGTLQHYVPGSLHQTEMSVFEETTHITEERETAGDIYIAYDGLLLGAFLEGKWVNVQDLQNSQQYSGKKLWGGTDAYIYSAHGLVSDCIMGALMNEHPEEFSQHGPLAEFPFFTVHTRYGEYKGDEALIIGGPGRDFNPLPRTARLVTDRRDHFRALVREYLSSQGLADASCRIRDVHAVDLDGDGTEEHIICAEDFKEEMIPPMAPKKGMYSVMLIETSHEGQRTVLPVASYIALKDAIPGEAPPPETSKLSICADVNNDGVMELIVYTGYYEGGSSLVFTLKNGKLIKLLSEGWGV
ncbi:MAG: sel1 repeat family protein [Desulfovibrio sp.]|nr:sel1 repeat family protein [Desulfovibrio sp.]